MLVTVKPKRAGRLVLSNPEEVNEQSGLDDTKDDRNGVGWSTGGINPSIDPVQDIEKTIGAEGKQIERIYNRRDRGLAQEKKLRENADRFEYYREVPEPLREAPIALKYKHGKRRDDK